MSVNFPRTSMGSPRIPEIMPNKLTKKSFIDNIEHFHYGAESYGLYDIPYTVFNNETHPCSVFIILFRRVLCNGSTY